jgi:hypothetical protein
MRKNAQHNLLELVFLKFNKPQIPFTLFIIHASANLHSNKIV